MHAVAAPDHTRSKSNTFRTYLGRTWCRKEFFGSGRSSERFVAGRGGSLHILDWRSRPSGRGCQLANCDNLYSRKEVLVLSIPKPPPGWNQLPLLPSTSGDTCSIS
eukprot:5053372-Amphidinium_carterae.1